MQDICIRACLQACRTSVKEGVGFSYPTNGIRVSVNVYTSKEEIDRFCDAEEATISRA